jgi:hypothetical protein
MQVGPSADAKTRRARSPISAERTTFASATTASGSEVAEEILLAHATRLALSRDLIRQPEKHLASNIRRELRRGPRQKKPSWAPLACDEDDVV